MNELAKAYAGRMTRREMLRHFFLGTGRTVPPWANLRQYASLWHAEQQRINAGGTPSAFWKKCVGI
jgi:hypothetical protein